MADKTVIFEFAVTLTLALLTAIALRRTAVDHVRQELFKIRNDMFAWWGESSLSYDTEAYALLRHDMNLAIRFADKLTFMVVLLAKVRKVGVALGAAEQQNEWDQTADAISRVADEAVRTKLMEYQQRARLTLGIYMLLGSPLGLAATAFILGVAMAQASSRGLRAAFIGNGKQGAMRAGSKAEAASKVAERIERGSPTWPYRFAA